MKAIAEPTIGDEMPLTIVPARVLDDQGFTVEQLGRIVEADVALFDVPAILDGIVLDPHLRRFSGYGVISPDQKQPKGEIT